MGIQYEIIDFGQNKIDIYSSESIIKMLASKETYIIYQMANNIMSTQIFRMRILQN